MQGATRLASPLCEARICLLTEKNCPANFKIPSSVGREFKSFGLKFGMAIAPSFLYILDHERCQLGKYDDRSTCRCPGVGATGLAGLGSSPSSRCPPHTFFLSRPNHLGRTAVDRSLLLSLLSRATVFHLGDLEQARHLQEPALAAQLDRIRGEFECRVSPDARGSWERTLCGTHLVRISPCGDLHSVVWMEVLPSGTLSVGRSLLGNSFAQNPFQPTHATPPIPVFAPG